MQAKQHIAAFRSIGASQKSLSNQLLDPKNIKIDERSTSELLAFIAKLSSQFWYYDENDERNGDWSDFFKTDLTAILAIISDSRKEEDYRKVLDFVKGIQFSTKDKHRSSFLNELFELAFSSVFEINHWYTTFTQYHLNHPYYTYLKEIIWKKFSFRLRDLYAYYYAAIHLGILTDKELIDNQFRKFHDLETIWNFDPFPIIGNEENELKNFYTDPTQVLGNVREITKDFYHLFDGLIKEASSQFALSLENGNMEPHIALLMSFLDLFKYQQQAGNDLVSKHLKFYFEEVLDFHKKASEPDSAYLLFKLVKGHSSYSLSAGTKLNGGVDKSGKGIFFLTQKDLLTVPSTISNYLTLKTIPVATSSKTYETISIGEVKQYDAPIVDKLTGKYVSFEMFGSSDAKASKPQNANIGFALTSPELYMEGGDRCLTITFVSDIVKTAPRPKKTTETENKSAPLVDYSEFLDISVTGKKGWLTPTTSKVTIGANNQLIMALHFNKSVASVSPYNVKVHGKGYSTLWPVLSVKINYDISKKKPSNAATKGKSILKEVEAYDFLKSRTFSSYVIDTKVNELSMLTLKTDAGTVPPASTILPFGSNPVIGSRLLVGCYEAFIKHTKAICLSAGWVNLPSSSGFKTYYKAYNEYLDKYAPGVTKFSLEAYKCITQYLNQGSWSKNTTPVLLFQGALCPTICDEQKELQSKKNSIVVVSGKGLVTKIGYEINLATTIDPDYTLKSPLVYSDKSKSGFISLALSSPEEAFGNAIYPQVVSKVTLENTVKAANEMGLAGLLNKILKGVVSPLTKLEKSVEKVLAPILKNKPKKHSKKPKFQAIPNKPFAPKMKDIAISYTSSVTLVPGIDLHNQFYHIHPFGTELITNKEFGLVPQYAQKGYAFWGFESLIANTSLTIFLALEDRLNTIISEDFQEPFIEILLSSGWSHAQVLEDTTYGLNKTGIIKFNIPEGISNSNTIMPKGNYWIRISANNQLIDDCKLMMVGTNVVQAKRELLNDINTASEIVNVSAGKITQFVQPVQAIAKVDQPFSSFGGENPENDKKFQSRVSQRLSNKDRGVSVKDYESLILEKFSDIYSVNVVSGRYIKDGKSNEVYISLIPMLDQTMGSNAYKPIASASALSAVLSMLESRIDAHLDVKVSHSKLEELMVSVDVVFYSSDDTNQLIKTLNDDLKQFLSPWIINNDLAYNSDELKVDELMKFIRTRSYVSSFSNFFLSLDGFVLSSDEPIVIPMDPLSVIISADRHNINADSIPDQLITPTDEKSMVIMK